MMRLKNVALVALLLALPAPVLAQRTDAPAPGDHAARMQHRGRAPFALFLEHRAELGLTDAQVARLEEISRRLHERNEPHVQRLREAGLPTRLEDRRSLRELSVEERQQLRQRVEAMKPTLQEMRKNRRDAAREAKAVLSEEQQARVRELLKARRGEHPREKGRHRGKRPDAERARGTR